MMRCILLSALVMALPATAFADEFDGFELDAPFTLEQDIPVVLTASRLKQPRAEVPASVTVIEAEQIRAWGVRTLPELMRFVPGMFIGHGDDENNASVAYHASSPSLMRRLQVLVDGRSVYKAGIAAVVWDDIPVAMEDILRIEVTRGPNAATYGANSFLGVINIVTKHPGDTLGTRLRYRGGTQGIDDGFISHSAQLGDGSFRLSAQIQADNGFDGRSATGGDDDFRDSKRHNFFTAYYSQNLDAVTQMNLQAGIKRGHTDIRLNSSDQDRYVGYRDQETQQGYVQGKLQFDFSESHQSHLQAYWFNDNRDQHVTACIPTVVLDPDLLALYSLRPEAAYEVLAQDFSGLSAEELALATGVVSRYQDETVCGDTNWDIDEQRIDVEWQDTFVWSDSLRTVSGASYRRDLAQSVTYFDGVQTNDLYRLFGNAEWRPLSFLLVNAGGMFEREDANEDAFSPRFAMNFLLSEQQSIRLVYSTAVRSPDMLEQEPNYSLTLDHLTDNYLGVDSSTYFVTLSPGNRHLNHEHIVSREIGYYFRYDPSDLEVDAKIYRDTMRHLISSPITLESYLVRSDTEMDIEGAELQLKWRPWSDSFVWMTLAHVAPVARLGDTTGLSAREIDAQGKVETRLSAENSMTLSVHKRIGDWALTGSHFWYNAYNQGQDVYRRYEVNVRHNWNLTSATLWGGVNWQHLVDDGKLIYADQRYSTSDIYYLQVGIDF
ncbi:TonB-dependent receptor plug domain-containing protein [Thalassolituus sp. LLYu03]|uniref:TonB-dependent receptor plug domain-containing protein n=1 Tax=Thalassolituus sp. LLYu03 TaxID=3421656 RepID=UPI003D2BFAE5